jgi:hypothetical protein
VITKKKLIEVALPLEAISKIFLIKRQVRLHTSTK